MNRSYIGSSQRTFQQAIIRLLETEYGFLNSRRVIRMLAEDVERLADEFHPATACVSSGWMVLTGTKATGGKAHPGKSAGDYPLVTLSWPVLLPDDIEAMIQMPTGRKGRHPQSELLKKRLQRIIEYGLNHPDGPVLLTCADLGLMLGRTSSQISRLLKELREETGKTLITKMTGLQPTVVSAYVKLTEKYHPDLLPNSEMPPIGA